MPSRDPIVEPQSGPWLAPATGSSSLLSGRASRGFRTGVAGASALLLAAQLVAQVPTGGPYSLPKQVIAGGGTRSSGGSYVLTGTAGQSAAGPASAGNYALQQGFHSATSSGPLPDALFANGFE